MKVGIRASLVLFALATAAVAPGALAIDVVEPTAQEKARCDAVGNDGYRRSCLSAYSVRPLTFPAQAQGWRSFTAASKMAIFKPDGAGPFPAVILMHTCAAVDFDPEHMRYWVKQAQARGYVAFVIDSWGPRGIPEGVCNGAPANFQAHIVRSRDAYEALAHLGALGFVDSARISAVGFSHGGRVAYQIASRWFARMFSPRQARFASIVSVYGQCYTHRTRWSYVRTEIDVPLLSLLGELDDDGDPRECVPRLRAAQEKGAPVEWHVFPRTGHAWDEPRFAPPRRYPFPEPSGSVLYGYDAKVTEETRDRVFAFLGRH